MGSTRRFDKSLTTARYSVFFVSALLSASAFGADPDWDAYGYGSSTPNPQGISDAVTEVENAHKKFADDPNKYITDMQLALMSLRSALRTPGSLPPSGPDVDKKISLVSLQTLLSKVAIVSDEGTITNQSVVVAEVRLRLAAQKSVKAPEAEAIEKDVIALSKRLDAAQAANHRGPSTAYQRAIIQGLGDLGSIGRLSPAGQLHLFHLLQTHDLIASESVAAGNAMQRVKPKSEKLVTEMLAKLGDPELRNQGFLANLIIGLKTETSDRVINALTRIAADPSQREDLRLQAILALMGGSYSYRGYPRKSAWDDKRIHDAILAASRIPSASQFGDSAVNEAKHIIELYETPVPKNTDPKNLTEHNPMLSEVSPMVHAIK